jgi:hypothetical protein
VSRKKNGITLMRDGTHFGINQSSFFEFLAFSVFSLNVSSFDLLFLS